MTVQTKKIKILGIDPSLSNWGMAYMSYAPNSLELHEVITISPKTQKIKPKSLDDLYRVKELSKALKQVISSVDIVVAELPIGSQSSRAMASYGICIGVLSQIDIPFIPVTPYQVKQVIGKNTTSKQEIINWVNQKHPNILDKRKTRAEHQADAVVTVYAAIKQIEEHYYANCI